jgi:hypothetical protein
VKRLLVLLLLFVSANPVRAHIGNENDTEVRVFSDSMRVVLRTSVRFAWIVLGDRAPAMPDEAGQAIAKPLLIAAAPGLIAISAAGKPLTPTRIDCVFEVQDDVAFVLHFPRPTEWPVVLEAKFFHHFGSLDTGTIKVFDYAASRFSRDLEPIVRKVIGQGNTSVSFSLATPGLAAEPPQTEVSPPSARAAPPAVNRRGKSAIAISILLLSAIGIGVLAWRRLSGA